ncbi:MAG: ComF family protein [Chloroflexota bacterium]
MVIEATGAPAHPRTPRLERALDLIFPPSCVGCRRVGRWICEECWPKVPWMCGNVCLSCGSPAAGPWCGACSRAASELDQLLVATRFEGIAREAVHALKFNGHHAISALMGRVMAGVAGEMEAEAVVALPLHPSRRHQRGYDQSALLARHLAHTLHFPLESHVLRRTRRTEQQASLDREHRQANVAGAFAVNAPLEAETVLLVDDVVTTGATMSEAGCALKEAGVERVVGLAFAQD